MLQLWLLNVAASAVVNDAVVAVISVAEDAVKNIANSKAQIPPAVAIRGHNSLIY